MKISWVNPESLKPYEKNARKNKEAIKEVVKSLSKFGWQQPIVVDEEGVIVAGHTRWAAAMEMRMKEVPVKLADDLTPAEIKAYRLMDNRTHDFSDWIPDLLLPELQEIKVDDPDLSPEFLGFNIEQVQEQAKEMNWNFEKAADESVITVRCKLDRQGEILESLKKFPDIIVESSNVKRFG